MATLRLAEKADKAVHIITTSAAEMAVLAAVASEVLADQMVETVLDLKIMLEVQGKEPLRENLESLVVDCMPVAVAENVVLEEMAVVVLVILMLLPRMVLQIPVAEEAELTIHILLVLVALVLSLSEMPDRRCYIWLKQWL